MYVCTCSSDMYIVSMYVVQCLCVCICTCGHIQCIIHAVYMYMWAYTVLEHMYSVCVPVSIYSTSVCVLAGYIQYSVCMYLWKWLLANIRCYGLATQPPVRSGPTCCTNTHVVLKCPSTSHNLHTYAVVLYISRYLYTTQLHM